MSSWIIAKGISKNTKPVEITSYHDTSSSGDVPSIYMEFLAAYIYSQKMGESCSVWDPTGILNTTFNRNPQVKLLKEKPATTPLSVSAYRSVLQTMKLRDFQKFMVVLDYSPVFTRTLTQVLEKGSIRQDFDIGIHIVNGANLASYADTVKAFQMKTKKTNFSVYVMSDSYTTVQAFQRLCSPTWKVVSLSRTAPKDAYEGFIQMMAEAQILSALPALVLDFTHTVDRYIYLRQQGRVGFEFFKEINDRQWALL